MKKILCFGSVNIDHVYEVAHFVQPGETISCRSHKIFPGGKGFNQSIALARAGCPVWHAGKIGADALFMLDILNTDHVNTSLVSVSELGSGHTVIQVDSSGENSIIVCPGANGEISHGDIDAVLSHVQPGDYLILQNEISNLRYILQQSVMLGMKVYLNPSPISDDLLDLNIFNGITGLILNEIEGAQLTGKHTPREIVAVLQEKAPSLEILLTLGAQGAVYSNAATYLICPAVHTHIVDTTAAGDTFTGYFLAGVLQGEPIGQVLQTASKAASIAISRLGAAKSIPYANEL